jgi:hypothetical protein
MKHVGRYGTESSTCAALTELGIWVAVYRLGSLRRVYQLVILDSVVDGRCCGYSTRRKVRFASISRRCDDSDVLITSRAKLCQP